MPRPDPPGSRVLPALFLAALSFALLCVFAPPASAQEEDENAVAFRFGAGVTTNYIFRGFTQSSDKPAFQPYAELEWRGLYGRVGASNVNFEDPEWEIDYYAGYRFSLREVNFDIGYGRYTYTNSGKCCDETIARVGHQAHEKVWIGGEVHQDFSESKGYASAAAAVSLPRGFSVSGKLGGYYADGEGADWNLGISYRITEQLAADLRYHDSSESHALVNATLSFDTDWSMFGGD